MAEKRIMRGIDKEGFVEAFKVCELYELYKKHTGELLIGVRNNYLNLYYNCDSIAKIEYKQPKGEKGKRIVCEIDSYYLDGKHRDRTDKEKRIGKEPSEICERYKEIKNYSDNKTDRNNKLKENFEKKAQSRLVISNNRSSNSKWFCVDVEYVKAFINQSEKNKSKFSCRFDIIALSKEKPHRVALIELKYGSKAFSGESGIYKHIEDFKKFKDKDFFENHLRQEIIDIIQSQKELEIPVPFDLPDKKNLLTPEFYLITLDNNKKEGNDKASTPKQSLSGYLFNDGRWDCKDLSSKRVEPIFGDVTKKDNEIHVTFLFSTATLENGEIEKITDIIESDNYDKEPK